MQSKIIRDIRLIGFIVPRHGQAGDYYDIIAWCFECMEWHIHGGFKREPEQGLQLHRIPHCQSESYKQDQYDGYVVEIAGVAIPEVLQDYQRKKPLGLKPSFKPGENPIAETVS